MKNKNLIFIIILLLLSLMLIVLTGCNNEQDIKDNNINTNLISNEENIDDKNDEDYGNFGLRKIDKESFDSEYTIVHGEYDTIFKEWFVIGQENNDLTITIIESDANKYLSEKAVNYNEKYIIKNIDLNDIESVFCGVEGQDIYYPSVFILQKDGTVKGVDTEYGYKTGEFIAKRISELDQVEKIEQADVFLVNDSGYIAVVATTKDGEMYEIRKGQTFKAIIEEVREYKGKTTILVDGLDDNDINYRGEFDFSINNDMELLWKGNDIEVSDFKVGQNVLITFIGEVMERYPGGITGVTRVVLLDK